MNGLTIDAVDEGLSSLSEEIIVSRGEDICFFSEIIEGLAEVISVEDVPSENPRMRFGTDRTSFFEELDTSNPNLEEILLEAASKYTEPLVEVANETLRESRRSVSSPSENLADGLSLGVNNFFLEDFSLREQLAELDSDKDASDELSCGGPYASSSSIHVTGDEATRDAPWKRPRS